MKTVADFIVKILRVIVAILGMALVVAVVLQILGRYVFSTPLPWTEELSRFLLVMVVSFGAPLAARYEKFVRVDSLINFLPERSRKIFLTVLDLIVAIFLFIVAFHAISYATAGAMQKSPVMHIRMSYIFSGMVFCPFICGFFFLANAVERIKTLKTETDDKGKEFGK